MTSLSLAPTPSADGGSRLPDWASAGGAPTPASVVALIPPRPTAAVFTKSLRDRLGFTLFSLIAVLRLERFGFAWKAEHRSGLLRRRHAPAQVLSEPDDP